MNLYTVGCYECGEFHAFESEDRAEDYLDAIKNHGCIHDGDHDNLAVVVISSDRIPMWD